MDIRKALIVVDMQYDFVHKEGSLYVEDAEKIIEPINRLITSDIYDHVILTQDWHPLNHVSFNIFPKHCIQDTKGAELVFQPEKKCTVFKKGQKTCTESFSAFIDSAGNNTGLHTILAEYNINTLDIVGVALEYCVKETAITATRFGYDVNVIVSLTRAVTVEGFNQTLKGLIDHNITLI